MDEGLERLMRELAGESNPTNYTEEYTDKAESLLIDGCSTFSRHHSQFASRQVRNIVPSTSDLFQDQYSGCGANLWYSGSPMLANPTITTALEVLAAEEINEVFPVSKIKFLNSGTEACMAAITYARAATQRKDIIGNGYHGWYPEFISQESPGYGCQDIGHYKKLSDEAILDYLSDPICSHYVAGVIVEPIQLDASDERKAFLKQLREACTKAGALLIFDEVITGLRVPEYCVSNWFEIYPDILCLGKAIGSGDSVSVIGITPIVDEMLKNSCKGGPTFVSSTFSGQGIHGAIGAIREYKENFNDVWKEANDFQDSFNQMCADAPLHLHGYGTRGEFRGDALELFMHEAYDKGYLIGRGFFFNVKSDYLDLLYLAKSINTRFNEGTLRTEEYPKIMPFFKRNDK